MKKTQQKNYRINKNSIWVKNGEIKKVPIANASIFKVIFARIKFRENK